jgi:hypothetical protein
MKNSLFLGTLAAWAACAAVVRAQITVVTGQNKGEEATAAFKIGHVPRPAKTGTSGKFTIVDGEIDGNCGGLEKLNDGRVPTE